MADKPFNAKDRLADYVEVKDRIRLFYEAHPEGRLVTSKVKVTTAPDGVPRVWVKALAYRTPDDPHPGPGWSWMVLPGTTPYTRGSELENTETSAWGRAIGALGIGIERAIASAQEVRNKEGQEPPRRTVKVGDVEVPEPDERVGTAVTMEGTAAAGKSSPSDMLLRQTPDGPMFGFVLVGPEGKGRTQVVAIGQLADDIWDAIGHDGSNLFNQEVTVHGVLERVPWQKDGRDMPPYKRLTLARIVTAEWSLPSPEAVEPVEAPSIPAFTDDDLALIR